MKNYIELKIGSKNYEFTRVEGQIVKKIVENNFYIAAKVSRFSLKIMGSPKGRVA